MLNKLTSIHEVVQFKIVQQKTMSYGQMADCRGANISICAHALLCVLACTCVCATQKEVSTETMDSPCSLAVLRYRDMW